MLLYLGSLAWALTRSGPLYMIVPYLEMGLRYLFRTEENSSPYLSDLEMRTDRPFPIRNAALEVQIGKQFFMAGGAGPAAGVFLTPEQFAQLKDGAEVIAFYNSPDRSGAFAKEIWYFGRLNKSMLDR